MAATLGTGFRQTRGQEKKEFTLIVHLSYSLERVAATSGTGFRLSGRGEKEQLALISNCPLGSVAATLGTGFRLTYNKCSGREKKSLH